MRAGRIPICETCLSAATVPQTAHPGAQCGLCGEALGFESQRFAASLSALSIDSGPLCTSCRRLPPPFRRAAAFGVYGGALRALLHLFKYSGVRALAPVLGRQLAKAIIELAPLLDPAAEILVVAVPLARARARGRGFNQAELLAAHAIAQLRRSHPTLRLRPAHRVLVRTRETESQFGLNPRQRRDNLRGAFATPEPALIAGRDLLLIDDIYTTGATARACTAALRRAGARSVIVATLARAQQEQATGWAAWDSPAVPVPPARFGQGSATPAEDPYRRTHA